MNKIKEYRKKAGLSQAELAQKVGVSEISIRKYENGERRPKLETLLSIADVLDVDINEFESLRNDRIILDSNELFELICGLPRESPYSKTSKAEQSLLAVYRLLNSKGQIEAVKRVRDLTYNPEYQRKTDDPFDMVYPTEPPATEGQPPAGADPCQDNNQDNE